VKGCNVFGNGSLYLQVKHDLCVGCNECSIARNCPAQAYQRIPVRTAYLLKTRDSGSGKQDGGGFLPSSRRR
jgi:electron transport complex protein RnfB